jgi:hypothetical protein
MVGMSIQVDELLVDVVAREAGLSQAQTLAFRNTITSWAMEGLVSTEREMRVGAEVVAGRLDFDTALRQLSV